MFWVDGIHSCGLIAPGHTPFTVGTYSDELGPLLVVCCRAGWLVKLSTMELPNSELFLRGFQSI